MTRCDLTCVRPTPSQAHCSNCHRTWGGIRGFDKHRNGGICHDPAAYGYELVKGIWRQPMSPQELARLTGGTPA